MAEITYISLENLSEAINALQPLVVQQVPGKGLSTNDLTNELKAQYDSAVSQLANIPTKVSQLQNDSDYQTATEVQSAISAQIGSVYKPGGSVAFASLPTPAADNLGMVYNVTDAFTTNSNFVEGAGVQFPAGTNVVVILSSGSQYLFDVLSGFVDLSAYSTTSAMNSAISAAQSAAVSQAVQQANQNTTEQLANYVQTSNLTPATSEEIQALFSGWGS